MKPINHHFALAVILAATLSPALMPQASAATPVTSTMASGTLPAEASAGFTQFLDNPLSGDLAELSTPFKYGLLLIGLSLIEKLSRKPRGW
ncbi:hypothetical protein [Aquabacterium sp.]|uniref:hypothetical protein n=1 Tax=Aquabacterium sp. TaxID=1872578 RepID=UPI003D6D786A